MVTVTRESLIVFGVLAALGAAGTAGVLVPQQRQMNELREQIAREKLNLKRDGAVAATVPGLVRQIEDMRRQYRDFDSKLPKQQELGGFLKEISSHLAQENLSNQLIEPGKPAREELFNTLPIILKFRGSFLTMAAFMKRVETMQRLTRVQRLVITPDKNSDGLNIEMQMNIYFSET